MKPDKVLSLIGLSMKAGKVVSGEFSTENAVKGGRAALVIISTEASGNTKKKFQNMCTYYKVPIYFYGSKAMLGSAMGKGVRTSLAVLDSGLAKAVEGNLGNIK